MKLVALKRAGAATGCTAAVAGLLFCCFCLTWQRMMISGLVMMISGPMMMITGVVNGERKVLIILLASASWSSNPVQLLALVICWREYFRFWGEWLWLFSSHFRLWD